MKDSPYFKQVQLILMVMPYIAMEERFALKGGTAINLLGFLTMLFYFYVLALLLERLAEIGSGRTWPRIKQGLEVLQISYFSTAEHGFYRTNELTNDVKKILKSLRISPTKLVRGVEKHSKNV